MFLYVSVGGQIMAKEFDLYWGVLFFPLKISDESLMIAVRSCSQAAGIVKQ